MRRAIVTLVALGMVWSGAGPAWAADGRKVDRKRTKRTPFFMTSVAQRMPLFVRARLARSYLRKSLPAFEASYKPALNRERRDWAGKVLQVASNALLTVVSIPAFAQIIECAQTKPGWAVALGASMAAIYGILNWRLVADRGTKAATKAAGEMTWATPKEPVPHQETALGLIERAWKK